MAAGPGPDQGGTEEPAAGCPCQWQNRGRGGAEPGGERGGGSGTWTPGFSGRGWGWGIKQGRLGAWTPGLSAGFKQGGESPDAWVPWGERGWKPRCLGSLGAEGLGGLRKGSSPAPDPPHFLPRCWCRREATAPRDEALGPGWGYSCPRLCAASPAASCVSGRKEGQTVWGGRAVREGHRNGSSSCVTVAWMDGDFQLFILPSLPSSFHLSTRSPF